MEWPASSVRSTDKSIDDQCQLRLHVPVMGKISTHKETNETRTPVDRAIYAAGGIQYLAEKLGTSRAAIYNWKNAGGEIPFERLAEVERVTGIPRWSLRPEIFDGMPLPDGSTLVLPTEKENVA